MENCYKVRKKIVFCLFFLFILFYLFIYLFVYLFINLFIFENKITNNLVQCQLWFDVDFPSNVFIFGNLVGWNIFYRHLSNRLIDWLIDWLTDLKQNVGLYRAFSRDWAKKKEELTRVKSKIKKINKYKKGCPDSKIWKHLFSQDHKTRKVWHFRTALSKQNSEDPNRSDKTVKTLIRFFTVSHSICFIYTSYFQENPNCSILEYISNTYFSCSNFYRFPPEKCLLKASECRKWLLWAFTVRIMFLLDQAGNLNIRWNPVLYARLFSHQVLSSHKLLHISCKFLHSQKLLFFF